MNDLTPVHDAATLASMPTNKLRAELAHGLTLTAVTLSKLGMVWAELERRGEDLSDLRVGIARTLPLIAAGRLAAEAVVAFAGRPMILRALEGVPLDLQRRLADGETIPVYLPGESAPKAMPLARIPSAAETRVIAEWDGPNSCRTTPGYPREETKAGHRWNQEIYRHGGPGEPHHQDRQDDDSRCHDHSGLAEAAWRGAKSSIPSKPRRG